MSDIIGVAIQFIWNILKSYVINFALHIILFNLGLGLLLVLTLGKFPTPIHLERDRNKFLVYAVGFLVLAASLAIYNNWLIPIHGQQPGY